MIKLKYIFFISILLISINAKATEQANVCLTGKIELIFPAYKEAVLNAVNLALSQNPENNRINVKSYFYDNKPLSPIRAYNEMQRDHCSAIIGFEYLSDLLLIAKQQKNETVPIFTSYASSNESDKLPKNIYMFVPTYDYQSKKMVSFLQKKFGKINQVLIVTEVDRIDLLKYKFAYEALFKKEKISYDQFNFIENDSQFESKLNKFIRSKKYNFVFVFCGAVGSTKLVNLMNDHKIVFIGTENFGSSTNPSLYVRLKDKIIKSFIVRNIDFLRVSKPLKKFMIDYNHKYSIMPSPLSAYTYDAMNIILNTYHAYHSINANNILKINYNGITGAYIKGNEFHRSSEYVILSIGEKGFINEQ